MTSEDWNLVSYEDAESEEQVILSSEFTAAAVVDALHDSPHHISTTAACIPGTHTSAKGKLSTWLANQSAQARNLQQWFSILWVHGPAGVGKTTLMQILANVLLQPGSSSSVLFTVPPEGGTEPAHPPSYEADEFRTAGIQYGGTALFFSRDHHITDAAKFFVTLAYGLARRLPPLAGFIQSAFDSTNQSQLLLSAHELAKTLILDPIKAWVLSEDGDVDVDLIIIIDGLDTFKNKNAETEVVDVVREVFTQRVDGVRWLWIFSSRTEARLHDVFLGSKPSSAPKAEEIVVRLASEAAMKAYLEGATAKIRQTHPAFQRNAQGVLVGRDSSPGAEREDEWPSPQDITAIQWQAAGLYAAASSMVSYIANPTSDPRTRISLIEDPACVHQDESDAPYTKLDTMYKDILAGVPPNVRPTTKRILGAISCMQPSSHDQQGPTLILLSYLLDITGAEILELLGDLHSVVNAPISQVKAARASSLSQDRFHLKFHHRSFDQFLRTPARSLDWGLDLEATQMHLARCCLHKLVAFVGTTGAPVWSYAQTRWFIHCWRTGKDTEAALGILPDLFEFDYSVLGSIGDDEAIVDRYFVEWLLNLQETTLSEWQLLNPGPFIEPVAHKLDLDELSTPGASGSSSSNPSSSRTEEKKRLPARKSYILGLEPAKQVYLVPFYDVKLQWRADLGQRIGPREKQWDWIRGFRVVPIVHVAAEDGDGEDTLEAGRAPDNEGGPPRKENNVTTDEGAELYT